MDKKHHQEIRDDKVKAAAPAEEQTSGNAAAAASPPSASSSPSHEFSFTISLHQPSAKAPDRTKSPPAPAPFAVDLTPADEIFFHGHLLPLHLLSHPPVSPRSSTNSLESFTLPIKEFLEDQTSQQNPDTQTNNHDHHQNNINNQRTEEKPKSSRSFSLFWLPKWRKGYEVRDKEEEKEKHGRKLKFDITQVVKRYMRMVRPLLSFRQSRRGNLQFDRQAYSYSGHLNLRGKKDIRGKRGEYSAPASMRTSPTNSGLLVPPATSPTSSSDSTMEELQAAIQAAIAHCKNSIQVEDKLKCQD